MKIASFHANFSVVHYLSIQIQWCKVTMTNVFLHRSIEKCKKKKFHYAQKIFWFGYQHWGMRNCNSKCRFDCSTTTSFYLYAMFATRYFSRERKMEYFLNNFLYAIIRCWLLALKFKFSIYTIFFSINILPYTLNSK